ncbi:uncharacterized protein LOC122063353 isoform X2 [Macadamia integrifolia]|uniref:uncharacterized protein LOC122063353 isoform X2 n=1 Tax=Macadamia integrifolia TaxID=60698 RepID=UPI001C4FA6D1|nr:uncharacterized protein LOC122063353 isoform X2 [Macadamia integrifolia]
MDPTPFPFSSFSSTEKPPSGSFSQPSFTGHPSPSKPEFGLLSANPIICSSTLPAVRSILAEEAAAPLVALAETSRESEEGEEEEWPHRSGRPCVTIQVRLRQNRWS